MPNAIDHRPTIRVADNRLTQRQAAAEIGVSFPTVSRYMTRGCHGVRLPSLRVGGRRYTTKDAIDWFFRELQARDDAVRNPDYHGDASVNRSDFEAEADAAGL